MSAIFSTIAPAVLECSLRYLLAYLPRLKEIPSAYHLPVICVAAVGAVCGSACIVLGYYTAAKDLFGSSELSEMLSEHGLAQSIFLPPPTPPPPPSSTATLNVLITRLQPPWSAPHFKSLLAETAECALEALDSIFISEDCTWVLVTLPSQKASEAVYKRIEGMKWPTVLGGSPPAPPLSLPTSSSPIQPTLPAQSTCPQPAPPPSATGKRLATVYSVVSAEELKFAALEKTLNKYERKLWPELIPKHKLSSSFDDVGGLAPQIEEIHRRALYPLAYPHFYNGQQAQGGILLHGAPGTGKTTLARCVAKCSKASFLSVNSDSINQKWFGESEKMVHAVFTLAYKVAPCIIFLDEVDGMLGQRSANSSSSALLSNSKSSSLRGSPAHSFQLQRPFMLFSHVR